ncbi:MAG TPA: magnesium chelatase [Clostridiaceae bacterium]|nr:magnesium chelatase [Clostridiaceae bacterium]
MELSEIKGISDRIRENIQKVIIGKSGIIDVLICAVIAGGHVLLEDVPGTGKTVLAKALSKSIGADFKRVQFTPDLLPSDLTGINYYNQKMGQFTFKKGPLFTNILLADEINRATPRTQSSLLECMEEKQISVDGITYKLDEPFFVIATQNPIEIAGTFPLPEAQLDRFLVRLNMGYPDFKENKEIIERFIAANPLEDLKSVCSSEEINNAKLIFNKVYISDEVQEYIIKITEKTLDNNYVRLGISPRGMLALVKMCQAYAAIKGSDFVTPDDVKSMAVHVFNHRLILKDSARVRGVAPREVITDILNEVPVPIEEWDKHSAR